MKIWSVQIVYTEYFLLICVDVYTQIEWLYGVQKCLVMKHRSFDVMMLISMGLILWTGLQLYGQLVMVAYETTIFEVTRDRNVKECMPAGRVCGNLKTFLCNGTYKVSRREGALEAERVRMARADSHGHGHNHSHDHGHCEHDEGAPLLSGDRRGRFRQGSFDLEMNAMSNTSDVKAESMARDRNL